MATVVQVSDLDEGTGTIHLPAPPTPGNVLLALWAFESEVAPLAFSPGAWTSEHLAVWAGGPSALSLGVDSHVVEAGDGQDWAIDAGGEWVYRVAIIEVAGIRPPIDFDTPDNGPGESWAVDLYPALGSASILVGTAVWEPDAAGAGVPGAGITTVDQGEIGGVSSRWAWFGYQLVDPAGAGYVFGGSTVGATAWWMEGATFMDRPAGAGMIGDSLGAQW